MRSTFKWFHEIHFIESKFIREHRRLLSIDVCCP
jgi:hypothetical protein